MLSFATKLPPMESCVQCLGDLIHLDGKEVCGICGWPKGRPLASRPHAVVPPSPLEILTQRVGVLEAENAALKARPAAVPAGAPALVPAAPIPEASHDSSTNLRDADVAGRDGSNGPGSRAGTSVQHGGGRNARR